MTYYLLKNTLDIKHMFVDKVCCFCGPFTYWEWRSITQIIFELVSRQKQNWIWIIDSVSIFCSMLQPFVLSKITWHSFHLIFSDLTSTVHISPIMAYVLLLDDVMIWKHFPHYSLFQTLGKWVQCRNLSDLSKLIKDMRWDFHEVAVM